MLASETLEQAVRDWLSKYHLADELCEVTVPAVAWTHFCSPPHSSVDIRTLASLDLVLWLFSIDDHDGDDLDSYYDQCLAVLDGRSAEGAVWAARRALLSQLAQLGRPLDRYLSSRRRYVEAVRRRRRGDASNMSFSEYLHFRETTIYMEQWVDLWEILGYGDGTNTSREHPVLREAVRTIAHCHILHNEPRSVARDIVAGTPNLVLLKSKEENCSEQVASEAVRRLEDAASARYDSLAELLRRTDGPSSYLGLLDACRFGGERASSSASARYGDSASLVGSELAD